MSTALKSHVELPEGYSVLERLGAGGYGEVWKATAPGGIEKALKVVFGHIDEELAERELKSLDRIKAVRHPFLLSIERYEIVAGRLVIVSELADESLFDSFERYRQGGERGIPRERLLAYLRDSAEALDCLAIKHGLLHLDVKPENLLVIDDHAKVADFGLVKELTSQTMHSMVGGMTPVYSAPEVFDDNPSSQSDQYSLAIVYQQMLTGVLPFPGRTAAQLAKQHTLSPPNVQSLPKADQNVVRRALSKNPLERYPTCVEFIAALLSGSSTSPSPGVAPRESTQSLVQEGDAADTASLCSLRTTPKQSPSAVPSESDQIDQVTSEPANTEPRVETFESQPRGCLPKVSPEVIDIETGPPELGSTSQLQPTLFIAAGGVGLAMLMKLRQRIGEENPDLLDGRHLAWLAIDTDSIELDTAKCSPVASLAAYDLLHIPLRRPKAYRNSSSELLNWVSRRWLYNIPRSLKTRGYRPLGRIAVVDHTESVLAAVDSRLRGLLAQSSSDCAEASAIRIVILAGMSGGTGSGIAIDLAQAVRNLASDAQASEAESSKQATPEVHALFGCTHVPTQADPLGAANMFSFLQELHHAQSCGNTGSSATKNAARLFESATPPFDAVYTLAIPQRGDRDAHTVQLNSIAEYLALEATTKAAHTMRHVRGEDKRESGDWGRTFNCINLSRLSQTWSNNRIYGLQQALLRSWLEKTESPSDSTKAFESNADSRFAAAVLSQLDHLSQEIEGQAEDTLEPSPNSPHKESIVRIAAGFNRFCEAFHDAGDHCDHTPPQELIDSLSLKIVRQICRAVGSNETAEVDVSAIIHESIEEHSREDRSIPEHQQADELLKESLSRLQSTVLGCGYHRRSLLIGTAGSAETAELSEAAKKHNAVLAIANQEIAPRLVHEGIGLSPRHLAAQLTKLLPKVAEAASRLHAREDIRWTSLYQ